MNTIPLPLLGIDMLSDETALPAGTARSAVNVDLGKATIKRRDGYRMLLPGHGMSGVYNWNGRVLLGRGYDLCDLDVQSLAVTQVASMGSAEPIDFHEYNESLYAANEGALWRLPRRGPAQRVGVRMPAVPDIESHPYGTLTAGRYLVAISIVDATGEESGALPLGSLQLRGGLKLTGLPAVDGHRWRVYMTPPDGDVLYLVEEFPALLAQHVLTVYPGGQPCEVLHLQPMPAGSFVRSQGGRLYVARGSVLWFSEALRPHLHRPASNFVQFEGPIRILEALDGGLLVGDDEGVHWLAGADPTAWSKRRTSRAVAVRRSSLVLPAKHFTAGAPGDVAVWLATDGYWLGAADGSARQLQPGRIAIDPRTEGRSVFLQRDGMKQLITLTAAHQGQVFGVAIDSTTT
jgi:hypothetical protein